MAPTSHCSRGSEDSISPSKRTDTDASDRSSGTNAAEESSSDGGRLFPVGEMSPSSELLPTPDAGAWNDGQTAEAWATRHERERAKAYNGNGGGTPIAALIPMLASTSSSEGSRANPPVPQDGAEAPPTTVGYGPSSPVSLANWDPDECSWRTSQVSLLSTEDERFPRSSERWPTSGMTRRGRAFALPMSARATDDSDSGSWLHTPTTGDTNPSYDWRASPGQTRANGVPNLAAQVDELLPTPDSTHGRRDTRTGRLLPGAVEDLLPTPKTPSGGAEARAGRQARGSGGEDLEARLRSLGDPTPPQSDDGSE